MNVSWQNNEIFKKSHQATSALCAPVDFLSTKSAKLPLFKESLAAFLPFLDSVDYLSLMLKEAAVFQIHYHDRIIVRNHLFFHSSSNLSENQVIR